MSHIFISYSRRDLDFAQQIVTALAENELDTWIDWKSIPKGEDWEQEIYRGIEGAEAFLFLISPDSVASEMCNKEIDHAVKNGKRILPIVLRDTDRKIIHPEVSKRNWIFCREGQGDFNKAIEEIQTTIHTDYEWLKYHTELQVKALKWEQKKDNSRLLRGKELREAESLLGDVGNPGDPQPTSLQQQFIQCGRENEKLLKKRISIGLAVILSVILAIAIIATSQWRRAEISAENELINHLLAKMDSIRSSRLDQALLLSVEIFHRSDTMETRNNLLSTLTSQPEIIGYINDNISPQAISYSPGGEAFIVRKNNEILFWDAFTGNEMAFKSVNINGLKIFTPDTDTGFASENDAITYWNLVTSESLGMLPGQQLIHTEDHVSRSKIESVRSGEFYFELRDPQTGKQLGRIGDSRLDDLSAILFSSPDGRWHAAAVDMATDPPMAMIFTWDLPESLEDYLEVEGEIYSNGSADHQWSFLGDENTDIVGGVNDVLFSSDGKLLIATVRESTDVVYLLGPGEEMMTELWKNNQTSVTSLTPECNGRIGVGRKDGLILIFDSRQTGPSFTFQHPAGVDGLVFSPDCNHMASVGGGFFVLYGLVNKDMPLHRLWGSARPNQDGDAYPGWSYSDEITEQNADGKLLIVSSCEKKVTQLDQESLCAESRIVIKDMFDSGAFAGFVTAMALSSNNKILAAGVCVEYDGNTLNPYCYKEEIRLWDVSSGDAYSISFDGYETIITSLKFNDDGTILNSINQEGAVTSWITDPGSWEERACGIAGRNFTKQEWEDFFPDDPYPSDRLACPQWPAGE